MPKAYVIFCVISLKVQIKTHFFLKKLPSFEKKSVLLFIPRHKYILFIAFATAMFASSNVETVIVANMARVYI